MMPGLLADEEHALAYHELPSLPVDTHRDQQVEGLLALCPHLAYSKAEDTFYCGRTLRDPQQEEPFLAAERTRLGLAHTCLERRCEGPDL